VDHDLAPSVGRSLLSPAPGTPGKPEPCKLIVGSVTHWRRIEGKKYNGTLVSNTVYTSLLWLVLLGSACYIEILLSVYY
jgi:hypothetical protein